MLQDSSRSIAGLCTVTRQKLVYVYNLLIAAALAVGFAVGYTLKGRSFQSLSWGTRPDRAYDKDFPGARSRYNDAKTDFSRGDFVRADYRSTLSLLDEAIREYPGYLPFHSLRAKVYEDWYENLRFGRVTGEGARTVAESLRLDPKLSAEALAEKCRELALAEWQGTASSPMYSSAEKYGAQWQVLRKQHVNALNAERNLQVRVVEGGIVDLTPAFSLYAITRDHDRYVSNVSTLEKGPTFEEKHMPDILRCPNHPQVAFQFPCLAYLSVEKTRTVREDVEFFRNAMAQDGQHLDCDDVQVQQIHLLCFNVTPERRIVNSALRLEFLDGSYENYPLVVGPWMQSQELLGDVAKRSQLDIVFRDSEVHLCNGQEIETITSPVYMYHVAVSLGRARTIDKIIFPRHDPASAALRDEGIADVRIVAVTVL